MMVAVPWNVCGDRGGIGWNVSVGGGRPAFA
jgi:hypothetical protein